MSNLPYDKKGALERMNIAMNKVASVYTEINLETMQYRQIDFNNAAFFSVEESGDYTSAFEYMCDREIYEEDVPEVRRFLSPIVIKDIADNQLEIDEISVQYKLKNAKPMKVMESRAVFIRNSTPKYVVVVAKDITQFAKLKLQHEQDEESSRLVREQLNAIMRLNPDAMSTFRLNLSKNTCKDGSSQYRNFLVLQDIGTIDGYVDTAMEYIPYVKEKNEFEKTFNLQALIQAFRNGITEVNLKHHYMVSDEKVCMLLTAVKLMKNKFTGDIEGVVYTLDITERETNINKLKILFNREYEGQGIINVKNRTYTLSKFDYEPDVVIDSVDMDYSSGAKRLAAKYVWPSEREQYLARVDLDNIVKELDLNGSYSFVTTYKKDGIKEYKRLFYYYLDEYKNDIFCVTEDITELTNKEHEQIERMKKAVLSAEQANEAKTLFLSSVSHDLRTPVNAIIGFTELAKESVTDEDTLTYMNKVLESSDFLLSLINDTLNISKIQTGKMTLEYSTVHIQPYIHSIYDMLYKKASDKNLHLSLKMEDREDYIIKIDSMRVKQIFLNILSNAIKFTPENGDISVCIEYLENTDMKLEAKISVQDNGIGMSSEFLPYIFDSFTQEKAQENENYSGTGLGMAITKGLIDLMDGKIEVFSEIGKGTQFIVYLSAAKSSEDTSKQMTKEIDYLYLSGKKILLCEDHPLNRELASRLLEKYSIEITLAENGKEGCELFNISAEGEYDAILMDIRMPIMDGIEATKYIRKLERIDAKDIPIIAMTANAYDEDRKETKAAGMTGHIGKPIKPKELYSTLANQIAEYRR